MWSIIQLLFNNINVNRNFFVCYKSASSGSFFCVFSYLRCSPDVIKSQRGTNSTFHHVSTVLKYLLPKKVPKAAMFGPGLETSTSGIVRKMLYENNDNFTRIAMFPGQFEG